MPPAGAARSAAAAETCWLPRHALASKELGHRNKGGLSCSVNGRLAFLLADVPAVRGTSRRVREAGDSLLPGLRCDRVRQYPGILGDDLDNTVTITDDGAGNVAAVCTSPTGDDAAAGSGIEKIVLSARSGNDSITYTLTGDRVRKMELKFDLARAAILRRFTLPISSIRRLSRRSRKISRSTSAKALARTSCFREVLRVAWGAPRSKRAPSWS